MLIFVKDYYDHYCIIDYNDHHCKEYNDDYFIDYNYNYYMDNNYSNNIIMVNTIIIIFA